ncbi:unnamed protein product [Spodoptera exigua]|nr:unnamed protein product [Spodoptera exigua]
MGQLDRSDTTASQNTGVSDVGGCGYHLATMLGLLPAQVINVYLGSTLRSMHDVLHESHLTGYVVFAFQVETQVEAARDGKAIRAAHGHALHGVADLLGLCFKMDERSSNEQTDYLTVSNQRRPRTPATTEELRILIGITLMVWVVQKARKELTIAIMAAELGRETISTSSSSSIS